jgi:hypothetical protein
LMIAVSIDPGKVRGRCSLVQREIGPRDGVDVVPQIQAPILQAATHFFSLLLHLKFFKFLISSLSRDQ